MAVLDFPDSPTVGQLYGSTDTVWKWDGSIWASTSGVSGARGVVATATLKGTTLAVPANPALTAIPGLVATFIADPSRVYRTTITGVIVGPLATGFELQIADGAGAKLQGASTNYLHSSYGTNLTATLVETGLSGSITRKAIGSGLGGACTFYGQPSFPAQIVVEDITFEAGVSASVVPDRYPRGVVGWGTFVGGSGSTLPVGISTITNPLSVKTELGRRYRMSWFIRAITATSGNGINMSYLGNTTIETSGYDSWHNNAGVSYSSWRGEIAFVGTGTTGNYGLKASVSAATTLYTDGASNWCVEDIGAV